MIVVTPHARGAVLPVRAKPGARRDAVLDEHGGALRVSVSAPPEDGRANESIARLLAETFGWKRANVHLLSGASSRDKKFLFEDAAVEGLQILVNAALASHSSPSPEPQAQQVADRCPNIPPA